MIISYGSLLQLLLTLTCLGCFQLVATFTTISNLSRYKRATCSSTEFTCDNNQCINRFLKCDGNADCSDKSDETAQLCLNLGTPCDTYSFQCKYGACIDGSFKCNGSPDCADGSDEDVANCTAPSKPPPPPPPEPPNGCRVPQTSGGQFILGRCNISDPSPDCIARTNEKLVIGTELILRCSKTYSLQGNKRISCGATSGWIPVKLPTCRKVCAPLVNPNLIISCHVVEDAKGLGTNKRPVRCDEPMFEGTIATVRCPLFFEQEERPPLRCGKDGEWSKELRECQPLCGYRDQSLRPTIIDGKEANHTEYPWHVGLYWSRTSEEDLLPKFDYKCGGSLISPYTVLTAAHCGWDKYNDRWTEPQDMYVALGKQKASWNDGGDKAQRFSVEEFKKPSEYFGRRNAFSFDVALIILATPVVLTELVFPVCVNYDESRFRPGDIGKIPGWGKTNDGKDHSETLLYADIPIMSPQTCLSMLNGDEDRYYTHDKFCGGFSTQGPTVNTGDSGGGLVFKSGRNNYVVGIVSTTLGKDNFYVSFYTNVSYHYLWITKEMK